MLPKRSVGTTRSLLFINALLLTTAAALPAFAQVEEVVVTAQRKSENVQDVPIQVSAFSAEDMAAHQITMAKDLQFATPNVTYTKTNFSGDDFTIRGIGNDVISGGGESGVSVSFDNIYIAGAIQDLAAYYDIDRVEVLEGPQSSLYGRGATAGSVNILPAKPDLENFSASLDASYGNYSANEDRGMVNIPLVTDELGLRIAFDREYNGGIVSNVFDNGHIDSNNTWSIRGTIRWQPTSNTTIDVLFSDFNKDDSTMRAQRQQCLFDPSGTLGCLAGGLTNDSINENAFFSADLVSVQGLNAAFAGGPLAGAGFVLGLSNLQVAAPHLTNPSGGFTVDTDFTPTWHAHDDFMAVNWKQHLASWLDFEANFGYDHGSSITQESYNNGASETIMPPGGGCVGAGAPCFNGIGEFAAGEPGVEGTLYGILAGAGGAAYANQFANYFGGPNSTGGIGVAGKFPVSNFNGLGISTNPANVQYYTNTFSTFDQSNAEQDQWSIDARFTSNFKGPINFMAGAFYLQQYGWGNYFVSSGAQGYASTMLGALSGLGVPGCFPTPGCTLGTVFYDNSSPADGGVTLKSKSLYGEVYWDIFPDLVKLTVGARWTDDYKSQLDRITLINGLVPIGDGNINDPALAFCGAPAFPGGPVLAPCATGKPTQNYQFLNQNFVKMTGRAVLDYTPTLDFTDKTLIYLSYSRGYKAGGFNPGLSTFAENAGVSSTYQPEGVDAFELGTKNMLLHSTLQANFDVWYYNYEGLQISQILDNDSINANVNSRMYGAEGNFVYAPDDHWAFNLNFGLNHSALGTTFLVDPRNPTDGLANAVLIKDSTPTATAAQNCAVYLTPAAGGFAPGSNPALPGLFAAARLAHPADTQLSDPYFTPPGGSTALAADGIPLTNYGSCNPAFFTDPNVIAVMTAAGYQFSQPGTQNTAGGVAVNLKGNQNPYSPPFTISVGVQYTFNFGEYALVPRFDTYYQTQSWGRVFEDPADRMSGYWVSNAQIQLNSPDNMWYAQLFMKNVFNKTYVTGQYLTSSSSGLYTNEFLGDPRMYGVRLGVHF